LQVPPTAAVNAVRFPSTLKKAEEVGRRSEKARQERNVVLERRLVKNVKHVLVEKVYGRLVSHGWGKGVGRGNGVAGIEGAMFDD